MSEANKPVVHMSTGRPEAGRHYAALYDAAQSELAALREELAKQKAHFVEQLRGAKCADKLQRELTSAMADVDDLVGINADLQQRLTAAEQRNALVESLLRESLEEDDGTSDWLDRVTAALRDKPTEPGARE